MQTVKLYDGDSHLKDFCATVLSCEKSGENYKIILDKTAFFPEAGGQPSDTGRLGNAEILSVKEEDGELVHYAKTPLNAGETAEGSIDFERRFSFMQNHSGEHIVSGIVYENFGLDNVSFHLNEEFVTIDFNGILDREQLDFVETLANEAVYKNLPVKAYYPTKEELENINYRSKKEIDGAVRIVEISGVDVCACCAPHVNFTGEIGMIKLLDASRMRGGTRVVLKCGRYALCDYRSKYKNIAAISDMLSSKQEETAAAVKNLLKKQDEKNAVLSSVTRNLVAAIIKSASQDDSFFYEESFGIKELQMLTDGLHKAYGGTKAAFSGENGRLQFAICGDEPSLNELFAEFKAGFTVRGGGRNGMLQGSVEADIRDIEDFFKKGV